MCETWAYTYFQHGKDNDIGSLGRIGTRFDAEFLMMCLIITYKENVGAKHNIKGTYKESVETSLDVFVKGSIFLLKKYVKWLFAIVRTNLYR